ncbi:MAG: sugar ABC transporter substrate-binding protein [Mesorhizobium sp.]|nr:MAG: sugar ABC transporter substrate-binding protein [Mesorhizobium sp.]RWB65009.1 MAG: sugar ABC transporter substrate-binding protein [Mesorhizobium sp.]RWB88259.1 MAG: sugar ABC transporter substrate-binding protein [Mesorhizobium sp.]RWC16802.1 MAG: sugar ABC transporter substrate-binding protein [Mesorhizobium sp.]RWD77417.1 MAG: sugar ABC transporter substrate-binding protein [Mesorhizobium sp.]
MAQEKPKTIYLAVGTTSSEYWQEVIWGAQQVASSVGAKLEVYESGFDGQKHMQQLGAILAAGCEGCAFAWFPDSTAFTKAFVERAEAGGAFMTTMWNRPEEIHPWDTASDAWIANISFDGVDSGYQNGMALCKAIGSKGGIAVLKGTPDNPPSKQREIGLLKAVSECPGMTILDTQIGNWGQTEGQNITRTWIARYGDQLKGVFAQNDGMALGAVAALREKGLAGKVPVTGSDGSSDVLKLIKSGEMLSSMRISSQLHGAVAAALAYAVASGDLKIGDLAQAQRDFYLVQTLATKDNVDAMLSAQPNPADFSYGALKKNFWARSKGQIPVGVN